MSSRISHNPYFNRWFSAIIEVITETEKAQRVTILILIDGFLQFRDGIKVVKRSDSHNPYFNRWFSAMKFGTLLYFLNKYVTILILIDGFLQYDLDENYNDIKRVTILILIDGFLQYG